MNTKSILLTILSVWILAIGAFVLFNQAILLEGTDVYLETNRYDPRDLLRGDHVTLQYALEREHIPAERNFSEDETVWVTLTEQRPAQPLRALQEDPETLAIRARTDWSNGTHVRVDLGLSQYYIPVGSGRDIPQPPWEAHLKVNSMGDARLIELLKDGEPVVLEARG